MGLLDRFFKGSVQEMSTSETMMTEKNTVYAPLDGMAIPLEEIGDGVFSAGVLGQGCGIRPENETVTAPFNGTILQVADTKHAVGIRGTDGIELLIHVGIDTVAMNGKGFVPHVKCGDKVKCGQKLLSFDRKAIAAAGYQDTTAILVTNSDDYQAIALCRQGHILAGEKLLATE